MWSYYGSKSKVVHLYPRPEYGRIIEPFAGSARYALRWFDRDVLLVDKYEVVVRLWKWLQQCSPQDITGLPTPKLGETIDRKDFDCDEQFWFMGFLLKQGQPTPARKVSSMGHEASGGIANKKRLISKQLYKIRHWEIQQGDFRDIPNQTATWFIDPPYQVGGEHYKFGKQHLNFDELAAWCKSRTGQVIVCENTNANWMQFWPIGKLHGAAKDTTEAIWTNRPTHYQIQQMTLDMVQVNALGGEQA